MKKLDVDQFGPLGNTIRPTADRSSNVGAMTIYIAGGRVLDGIVSESSTALELLMVNVDATIEHVDRASFAGAFVIHVLGGARPSM